jgi:hypothetical protein
VPTPTTLSSKVGDKHGMYSKSGTLGITGTVYLYETISHTGTETVPVGIRLYSVFTYCALNVLSIPVLIGQCHEIFDKISPLSSSLGLN